MNKSSDFNERVFATFWKDGNLTDFYPVGFGEVPGFRTVYSVFDRPWISVRGFCIGGFYRYRICRWNFSADWVPRKNLSLDNGLLFILYHLDLLPNLD
jgi:hypothetical protein